MVNEVKQNELNFYSTSIKTKKQNADEFQATLNDIKEQENKQEGVTNLKEELANMDLDLSKTLDNFKNYAQTKVYTDGLKQVQTNYLNNLFNIIDNIAK